MRKLTNLLNNLMEIYFHFQYLLNTNTMFMNQVDMTSKLRIMVNSLFNIRKKMNDTVSVDVQVSLIIIIILF